jgi:hypothetical protein
MPTFIEGFAGGDMVRYAVEPRGWGCLLANDNDPQKAAIGELTL